VNENANWLIRMNYRHAYHAGNFADVVKHVALTGILLHLRKKETAFAIIDTHAGRGLYDLTADEATRTGEAGGGIGRLDAVRDGPAALLTYLDLVRTIGPGRYPGSPLIAAWLMRSQDRLVAIEKHPEDVSSLKSALANFRKARAIHGDGYGLLPGLLPPPERRGLVLIDPPFESSNEMQDAARALVRADRRFSSGIFLVWFPTKSVSESDRFCGELLSGGIDRAIRIDIEINSARVPDGPLSSAGLVVVNPPFGFHEEMLACLDILAPLLGRSEGTDARTDIRLLAGE
jgi:23S rRNA (adenine2030-N6)-methyltransferase